MLVMVSKEVCLILNNSICELVKIINPWCMVHCGHTVVHLCAGLLVCQSVRPCLSSRAMNLKG